MGYMRDSVTCTGRLQQWNQPRNKHERVMKLTDMDWKRPSISKQCFDVNSPPKLAASELEGPHAVDKRSKAGERVEAIVAEHIRREAVTGIAVACGSRAFDEHVQKKRLARRDKKRQEWQRQLACLVTRGDNGDTCHPPITSDFDNDSDG